MDLRFWSDVAAEEANWIYQNEIRSNVTSQLPTADVEQPDTDAIDIVWRLLDNK